MKFSQLVPPLFLFSLLLLIAPVAFASDDTKPNILLLISDDHDEAHAGFMGNPQVKTPTLDRLAKGGVLFSTGLLPMSRCRPSLASFLTGLYPHQHGIYYNYGPDRLKRHSYFPEMLRDAGYATFAQGIYWEGNPRELGFAYGKGKDYAFARKDQDDLFDFLDLKKQPFFVWYAPRIPHLPHRPPQKYLDLFAQSEVIIPDWVSPEKVAKYQQLERLSFAMETWYDDNVGKVLEKLSANKMIENTIIVFVIDNGWCNGLVSKGSAFDKGLRTPIIVHWPKNIKGGRVFKEMVSTLDVVPTLIEYAGLPVPANLPGHSLKPALEGGDQQFSDILFGAIFPSVASKNGTPESDAYAFFARTNKWKYIHYVQDITKDKNDTFFRIQHVMTDFPARKAGDEDLYDLEKDPYELHNLSNEPEYKELLADFKEKIHQWWVSTGGKGY